MWKKYLPLIRRPASCLCLLGLTLLLPLAHAEEAVNEATGKDVADKVALPGIKIDAKNKRIDVDAKIALSEGLLELVACTKDSKEHESLVVVEATPLHIHTALLLIGANNGHPAMVKPANEEKTKWLHLPPRGDPIAVSLVYPDPEDEKKTIERPISDFLKRTEDDPANGGKEEGEAKGPAEQFDTFVFAGSIVSENEKGERQYVADVEGNVISISTFGDEVICLPAQISKENAALVWAVDAKNLPKVGTKVKLRLTLKELPEKEEQE